MKVRYFSGSEEDWAKFWLKRTGWKPTDVAKRIAEEYAPGEMVIADIGGGHGRDTLWLSEKGFYSVLLEPNRHSLKFAKERARRKKLACELVNSALPYLPIRSEKVGIVDFYWTLHGIRDEDKQESLKEVRRILKPDGVLYSTSFGYWEGHEMPDSIHPIVDEKAFIKLHTEAGLKPITEIEKRSDDTYPFEKFWYGEFKKNPPCTSTSCLWQIFG